MSSSANRSLAAVASACALGLSAMAFALSAPPSSGSKPVVLQAQASNLIVIPGPDQVSNVTDVSLCTWLKAGDADTHPMNADSMRLLTRPLAAAEYAANGMSGVRSVARLYGC